MRKTKARDRMVTPAKLPSSRGGGLNLVKFIFLLTSNLHISIHTYNMTTKI